MASVELPCPNSLHQSSRHPQNSSSGFIARKPCFRLSFLCSNSLKTEHALPYRSSPPHSRPLCALHLAFVGLSFHYRPAPLVACRRSEPAVHDFDSDSDSDCDRAPEHRNLQELAEEALSHDELPSSTPLPRPAEEISWLLSEGEDVPTMVSNLSVIERYAPHRLLEFVTKKLDSQMFSLAQLKSTLMFWQRKKLQEDPSFGSSAFAGMKGVSQLHQWTATELTLQHAQLSRIARDVLYLILACSLLGFVRVLEALVVTFSSSPPCYAKLLEATNSLDFFTVAFLAYSLRKPIIGILNVDPTNLDEVVQLKAKIWEEMHKFYERQWKVVATLGVGRLLAMIAQTLPSTNAVTKNVKMCWDMLLALPIF